MGQALPRATYGAVSVAPKHGDRETFQAKAWTHQLDGARYSVGRDGSTPEEAMRRLCNHLRSRGLNDARTASTSAAEVVTNRWISSRLEALRFERDLLREVIGLREAVGQ